MQERLEEATVRLTAIAKSQKRTEYRVTKKEEDRGGGEVRQRCAIAGAGEVSLYFSAIVLFNLCNYVAHMVVVLCSVA